MDKDERFKIIMAQRERIAAKLTEYCISHISPEGFKGYELQHITYELTNIKLLGKLLDFGAY